MMISIIPHLPIWIVHIIGYLRFDNKGGICEISPLDQGGLDNKYLDYLLKVAVLPQGTGFVVYYAHDHHQRTTV